ncbi:MAG: hypothetical protein SPI53_04530 [Erysipelotrichaceae bacterium]|nr:hypothetical protein [Erysipelotrichaceae bacterium]
MKNKTWYYNLIIDTRQLNILSEHSAVNKILAFLADAHLKWIYKAGDLEVISMYEHISLSKSNLIIFNDKTSVHISDTIKAQAIKEEEELALFLFTRINSLLSLWVKNEHIIAVFYYNMIKNISYKDMVDKKLYNLSKAQFYRDKDYVYKLCANAWCLSEKYNQIYISDNLMKLSKGNFTL